MGDVNLDFLGRIGVKNDLGFVKLLIVFLFCEGLENRLWFIPNYSNRYS